jgi:hypothetical protein
MTKMTQVLAGTFFDDEKTKKAEFDKLAQSAVQIVNKYAPPKHKFPLRRAEASVRLAFEALVWVDTVQRAVRYSTAIAGAQKELCAQARALRDETKKYIDRKIPVFLPSTLTLKELDQAVLAYKETMTDWPKRADNNRAAVRTAIILCEEWKLPIRRGMKSTVHQIATDLLTATSLPEDDARNVDLRSYVKAD